MTATKVIELLQTLPPETEVYVAETYYNGGGDEPENLEEPELAVGNGIAVFFTTDTKHVAENATKAA